MKGLTRIVASLSFSSSSVLVPITAGTVHPNPISNGTKALPLSPIFLIALSIINATLAIYPVSSSREIAINKIIIPGKKVNTPPTPAIIPSPSSDCNHSAAPADANNPFNASAIFSNPSSIKPINISPIPKVRENTAYIISPNIGNPNHLLVTTLSILSEVVSNFSLGLLTDLFTTFDM